HRYSVDGEWRVPHFEKMLYDQAQLVMSYVDLYQITHDEYYATIVRDVLDYVMRDMTDPEGGFYSAEDADSGTPEDPEEKAEGAFYVWTKDEIISLLGKENGDLFSYSYGIEDGGNALHDPQNEFVGKNILYVAQTAENTARQFSRTTDEVKNILARCRGRLMAVRVQRPRPHLDDKILTSWNGLMISAFARAHQVLRDPQYLQVAERAANCIATRLYDQQNKILLRRYRDGDARFEGHLDDYSFLVQGLLDLYEAGLDFRHLQWAVELTRQQNTLFWDTAGHGFFETSGKDSSILLRMKEQYDGAEPAGNSIAALNLLRLSQMTDNAEWRTMAEQIFAAMGPILQQQPSVAPQMSVAVGFSLSKPKQIVIAGDRTDANTWSLLEVVNSRYLPNKIILLAEGGEPQDKLATLLPFVSSLTRLGGKPTAYICEDYVCQLPTVDRSKVEQLLK
ncbi:MAG: thioredoxin domain-containing protein, partial [Ignavibacteria bacterium]|nr:thioredoxin domain-containing protein [Ignavibacteria bacterium]